MATSYQEHVSSFEAIISSIKVDAEVCRWFEFFVTQPALAAELASDPQMSQSYRDIEQAVFRQRILFAAALISMAAVILLKTLWALLAVPFILYFWIRLQRSKNAGVVSISEYLIRRDHASLESLSHITLYQLSEEYAHKYGIASLVDKIYCFDQVKRYSIFIVFVFGLVIWVGIFSWKVVLGMVCYYELIKAALMTTVVYRRLQ